MLAIFFEIMVFFLFIMIHSITITKCDFPEPNVAYSQEYSGFKTSITGLSIALSGNWATKFGILWVSLNFQFMLKTLLIR